MQQGSQEDPPTEGGPSSPAGGAPPSEAPVQAPSSLLQQQRKRRPNTLGLTRDTRYTVEQVLDGRTVRHIQFVARAANLKRVFGAISCGKEANVYFALGEKQPGEDDHQHDGHQQSPETSLTFFALKVYRTSILSFKDRSRYVQGDFRFNNAYSRWVQAVHPVPEEHRNLLRFRAADLPCPRPVALKGNVLLMEFVGNASYAGRAASMDGGITCRGKEERELEAVVKQGGALKEISEAFSASASVTAASDASPTELSEAPSATAVEAAAVARNGGSEKSTSEQHHELCGCGDFSFSFSAELLSYEAAPRVKDLSAVRSTVTLVNTTCSFTTAA
ncbi:rio1 family domain-containing protein [Cyclospora cayetanensis]|uniref:non-specific serine/threonine protein kinase n=1 Tax=Cyclospora cayetanensis TaxID=88456 RepID=A0A1D3D4U3_9EIME|nr:rio1 family domain-containing protein [Cyclospora cayetanensis]